MSIFMRPGKDFVTYFGVPGSGKTTIASAIVKNNLKNGRKTYSNVPILGAYQITRDDIGKFWLYDSDLIIDEAGIDYNNRDFKNFKKDELQFFKKHRHYKMNIYMFSQSYEDMDLKLRVLTTKLYLIKRGIIPAWITARRIYKKIDIDELTKKPTDTYYFGTFIDTKRFLAYKYWSLFKTEDPDSLPIKEFKLYDQL